MTDTPPDAPAEKKPAPWRGRRTVVDPKDHFVAVRCTGDDHAKLTELAARAGLSVGAYLRTMGLGDAGPRARRRPPLEREAIAELLGRVGRVGSNVNQLTKLAHTTGNPPTSSELARMADDIAAIRAALMNALGRELPSRTKPSRPATP